MVTSQTHFVMISESREVEGLIVVKKRMADYLKDVSLSPLNKETSMKFLESSMVTILKDIVNFF